jgi:hypothetical protein
VRENVNQEAEMITRLLTRAACAGLLLVTVAGAAAQANVLTNPGFESGLTGWIAFGNVYAQTDLPPQFVAHSGTGLVSMFGTFSGGFGVSGMFQEFPTVAGATWEMWSCARHFSGDAMFGGGAPNSNWVVQKMAFFDAANVEIGAAESTILDGTYATDTWHAAAPIYGVAPAGTVKVQAFILYLQPAFDGGAAHIDDVMFREVGVIPTTETTWGSIKALY